MFRKAFIVLLFLGYSLISSPQNFNGGLLFGLSATQVDGDGHGGYNRAGLAAGVWVGRHILPEIAIRTELKFLQKGSYKQFIDDNGGVIGFYSLRLNYIEMPYLLEYRFRENIIPFVGLSIGFLWKANESTMEGPFPEEDVAQFRKVEMAGTAGVEYIINKHFSFCTSISYSAIPVRPHRGNISYRLNRGQHNNVLQFYFRYHF
ncbi:MAG: outer membrane beta-barrel protein [Tenuifilaceae bacterium]|jgi:hypothetical protein|nr:outer membrane beta-barrel protein [Tenuifilaceae bacterium]